MPDKQRDPRHVVYRFHYLKDGIRATTEFTAFEGKGSHHDVTVTITEPTGSPPNPKAGSVWVKGTFTGAPDSLALEVCNLDTGDPCQTDTILNPTSPWEKAFNLDAGQHSVATTVMSADCVDKDTVFFTVDP